MTDDQHPTNEILRKGGHKIATGEVKLAADNPLEQRHLIHALFVEWRRTNDGLIEQHAPAPVVSRGTVTFLKYDLWGCVIDRGEKALVRNISRTYV